MQYPEWTDRYGLYHTDPYPDPVQSENSPLFSAYVLTFKLMTHPHLKGEVKKEARQLLDVLRSNEFFNKYATKVVELKKWDEDDLSHDNYKGIAVLHFLAEEPLPFWYSFRAHWRPDNLMTMLYCWAKTNVLFGEGLKSKLLPFLGMVAAIPATSLILLGFLYMVLVQLKTHTRHYKIRNGIKIPVTDGKLMSLMLFQAWGWDLMVKLSTKLIQKNRLFGSWYYVSSQYFRFKEHPVNLLIKEWETNGK